MEDINKQLEEKFDDMMRASRSVSLSAQEKEEMKRALRLFIAENPVKISQRRQFLNWNFYMKPFAAACGIVLVIGTGTSYAAQTALPGDLLYGVKVGVNEKVAGAFAVTAAEKAQWSADLTTRRLEEVETLVASGRFSDAARAQVQAHFSENAKSFDAALIALAQEPDSVEKVADAQSDLEASLSAHATVLADLTVATSSEREVLPILETVRDRVKNVARSRKNVEGIIAVKTGETIKTAATEKKKIAESHVSERGKKNLAPALMAAPSADVQTEDKIQIGTKRLQEGQYGRAFTTFQAAIRAARRSEVQDEVRERLESAGIQVPAGASAPASALDSDEDTDGVHATSSDSVDVQEVIRAIHTEISD